MSSRLAAAGKKETEKSGEEHIDFSTFQPNCDTHPFLFKNKRAGKYGSNVWILSD